MNQLTLENLVDGLETFKGRYQALDVFIADIAELGALAEGTPVTGAHVTGPNQVVLERPGGSYLLQLYPEAGVARLTRQQHVATPPAPANTGVGALLGAAAGAVLGAGAPGLLLGLLVGAALGSSSPEKSPARRVFALCFDPAQGQWRAYEGGLVTWMKDQLAAPQIIDDLPDSS